jgi:ergothioneine biosynthesis protein EgtB
VEQVFDYRSHVDTAMQALLVREEEAIRGRVVLGLNHEQQHQELVLTDIKYNLGTNPLRPAYSSGLDDEPGEARPVSFVTVPGGLVEIGAAAGFTFDNETPRHRVWLSEFSLADRLVSSGEYLAFMADGGYRNPALWLSEGWTAVQRHGWNAPLYWYREDGEWFEYRLGGSCPVDQDSPVCHVSFFEAEAFARWAGARLPTEAEWETVASLHDVAGNFSDGGRLHPRASTGDGVTQLFGDAWEWTASAYGPYPGFKPLPGTLGEYNGKFMANQIVLRGGSCATPPGHVRPSYRNFFYAPDRWQFSGIRLARDAT